MRRRKKTREEIEAEKREKVFSTSCVLTYRFRIKGGFSCRNLDKLAPITNLVWNFCNATSFHAIRDHGKWLSQYDLNVLTTGTTKELDENFHSQSVNAICEEYVTRRVQFKKRKLRWRTSRGSRRSLGWIPFKSSAIKVKENKIIYGGKEYKFWKSREIQGKILSGSFSQDSRGDWYVNVTCEVPVFQHIHQSPEVGVDLGLKDSATLSDGFVIENKKEYRSLEVKLGKAQRARKPRQVKNINRQIKNKRIDYLHKETTKAARKNHTIFVGNVSGKFLQATNGKSSADASIGKTRDFLKYKAMRHSGRYVEVDENSSTITCSNCLKKTGPSGFSDLGVREWSCSECHSHHGRDINAAKNILRVGRDSLRAAKAA